MTACDHRLGDHTGLLCVLDAGHPPGCVFRASWAPDLPRDEETDQ